MDSILEVNGLCKRYGDLTAVDNISFTVEKGSLFAFLGPNGAGKSTTISMICTIMEIDEGRIFINGHEVGKQNDEIRRDIGVVFQNSLLDNLLTVKENIVVRAKIYGIRGTELKNRLDEVVETLGLNEFVNKQYGKLSGGQRRRVDIARALINNPRILFLDEPTTGLDPQTRLKVWNMVDSMQKHNKTTVFLTTHYMEEAAAADDVAIIDYGRIVAQGTPASLKNQYSIDSLVILPKDLKKIETVLKEGEFEFSIKGDTAILPVSNSMHALSILKLIEQHVDSFEVLKGNMDTVFMNITGRKIRCEEDL